MDRHSSHATATVIDLCIWWLVAIAAIAINTSGALTAALVVSIITVLMGKSTTGPLGYIVVSSIVDIFVQNMFNTKWYILLAAMVVYSIDTIRAL